MGAGAGESRFAVGARGGNWQRLTLFSPAVSRRTILLFVKHPDPGKVKTRLAAAVGAEEAAGIYRRLVAEVCRTLPRDAAWRVIFDPPERRPEVETWLREMCGDAALEFYPQAPGELGARLERAFAEAFADGCDFAAAIGSDCIELSPGLFDEAWNALCSGAEVVIGPSADGGYYLIALRGPHPQLFSGIVWSTEAVLSQTLARAEKSGLRVHLLGVRHDVDTAGDWQRALARLKS